MRGFLAGCACMLLCAPLARPALLVYDAFLSGPSESPPNASPGTGFAVVTFDTVADTMRVQASFSGLLGTTTASHIHAPTPAPFSGTAGVATTTPTFPGFPLGVTSGTYDMTFDLSLSTSWNAAFISANGGTTASATAAFEAAVAAGESYLNIHSTVVPGGEIRGFLVAVPEPGTLSLAALALGVVWRRRRRERRNLVIE
jgi:CHRD domain-containing protein/PEP-CTERM motif-containing protein